MKFAQFNDKCGNESDCVKLFIRIYYHYGLYCILCKQRWKLSLRKDIIKNFQCNNCNNTFSIFKETILWNSRVDFRKWLYAFYLLTGITNVSKCITADSFATEININYRTAWRILSLLKKSLKIKDTKLTGALIEINDKILNGYLISI